MNVIGSLSEGHAKFVPDILVTGGGNGGSAIDGLAAAAMRFLGGPGTGKSATAPLGSAEPGTSPMPGVSPAPIVPPGGGPGRDKGYA